MTKYREDELFMFIGYRIGGGSIKTRNDNVSGT